MTIGDEVGVSGAVEEGVGGVGVGDLRTYSNQAPARPDETHAARIAARPILGFVAPLSEFGGGCRMPSN